MVYQKDRVKYDTVITVINQQRQFSFLHNVKVKLLKSKDSQGTKETGLLVDFLSFSNVLSNYIVKKN